MARKRVRFPVELLRITGKELKMSDNSATMTDRQKWQVGNGNPMQNNKLRHKNYILCDVNYTLSASHNHRPPGSKGVRLPLLVSSRISQGGLLSEFLSTAVRILQFVLFRSRYGAGHGARAATAARRPAPPVEVQP